MMPKRSNAFQSLVTLVTRCLADTSKVTESALLEDKVTGAAREVDIVISTTIAEYAVNISIEVRDRGRKADTTWVEEMHAKHTNLSTNKLILVSRSGFTNPAFEKAKFFEIETITFEEAFKTDWELGVRMTAFNYFSVIEVQYRCEVLCSHPNGNKLFSRANRKTEVHMEGRDEWTTIDEIARFFLFDGRVRGSIIDRVEKTEERTFRIDCTLQRGRYVFDEDGSKMEILRFTLHLELEYARTPISFAVGKLGRHEVGLGHSTDPESGLCFALVRKEDGKVDGLLLDSRGVRKLTLSL